MHVDCVFLAKNITVIACSLSPYGCCVLMEEQVADITEEILSLIRRSGNVFTRY